MEKLHNEYLMEIEKINKKHIKKDGKFLYPDDQYNVELKKLGHKIYKKMKEIKDKGAK